MLIFHEGLPRSGKTYEAVAKHLIAGLKKGRRIFARIDGLQYEQLAKLAGISVDKCHELLTHVDEQQIQEIEKIEIPIGSLVIIDELQNYFPDTGRKALSAGVTKFVSEHGHQGLDIVFMGQDLKDCHKIWRRRVDIKILFTKLDMLGSKKYRWRLFKAIQPEKFKQVNAGETNYDPAIFGSYKSFEPGAEEAQAYDDKRSTIWNSRAFKYFLPLVVVVGVGAVWFVAHLFWGGGLAESLGGKKASKTPVVASAELSAGTHIPRSVASPVVASGAVAAVPAPAPKKYERDFVGDLCEMYRLRVSGVMRGSSKVVATFEWFDEGFRVRERLTLAAVEHLGYRVVVDDRLETATLTKGAASYVATQFPLDSEGRISDERIKAMRPVESKS
jgi:zona occludens toxin